MVKKARPTITEPQENASRMLSLAKSDLSIARDGKKSDDTLYETLCTSCQQSIEKSFKALMIHHKVPYPAEHSISVLIDEMEKQRLLLPDDIKMSAIASVRTEGGWSIPWSFPWTLGKSVSLSEYAGNRRYSLPEKTLTEQDFNNVLMRAEKIVNWVEQQIQKQ
jgi:HEPN domain-containing protein